MSYVLGLDGEHTGPRVTDHSMVGAGAALYKVEGVKLIESLDMIIKPRPGTGWSKKTIANFWDTKPHLIELRRSILAGAGISYIEAGEKFYEFLLRCFVLTGGDMVIAMDKSTVDSTWFNYYLSLCGKKPLHLMFGTCLRIVDTDSFALGACRVTHTKVSELTVWLKASRNAYFSCSEYAFNCLKIQQRAETRKTHKCLDDAKNIAESHCILINTFADPWFQYISLQ